MDFILEAVMMVMMALMWTIVMWCAIMSQIWYVFLIPFAIGGGIGLYRKDWRFPVLGLGVGWILSWVVAFASIWFVKF